MKITKRELKAIVKSVVEESLESDYSEILETGDIRSDVTDLKMEMNSLFGTLKNEGYALEEIKYFIDAVTEEVYDNY